MFVLETMKDGHKTSTYFQTMDEAFKYFKLNDKIGLMCALYNIK